MHSHGTAEMQRAISTELIARAKADKRIYLERRRVKRRWQLTALSTIRCTLPDSSNEISVQNVLLSRML